jgi:hypothetical protein
MRKLRNHAAFGMWKNRKDLARVARFVRNLRKGRSLVEEGVHSFPRMLELNSPHGTRWKIPR